MATQEIGQEEWGTFLDSFSKQHEGKTASVQIFGAGTGDHQEARSLPFVGASFEAKGSEAGAVMIMLGTETDDHVNHTVPNPSQVWHDSGEDRGEEVLEIRSKDGQNVLVRFGL